MRQLLLTIDEATPSANEWAGKGFGGGARAAWFKYRTIKKRWIERVGEAWYSSLASHPEDTRAWMDDPPKFVRVVVRRHGWNVLDVDNLYGGFKPLLDALRELRMIVNDDPTTIDLVGSQNPLRSKRPYTTVDLVELENTNDRVFDDAEHSTTGIDRDRVGRRKAVGASSARVSENRCHGVACPKPVRVTRRSSESGRYAGRSGSANRSSIRRRSRDDGRSGIIVRVRHQVSERDRTCRCCGSDYGLTMHEICSRAKLRGLAPEQIFNTRNCVILCMKCHEEVQRNRWTISVRSFKGADGSLLFLKRPPTRDDHLRIRQHLDPRERAA